MHAPVQSDGLSRVESPYFSWNFEKSIFTQGDGNFDILSAQKAACLARSKTCNQILTRSALWVATKMSKTNDTAQQVQLIFHDSRNM
uniref:Uncharacterized protein n=1 Tax=Trichuris muris TaxID=70415 RepID=A0A5S6QCU3_TRIMR